jgi:hypothetical protein
LKVDDYESLARQYRDYAELVTGRTPEEESSLLPMIRKGYPDALRAFKQDILREQVMCWGGVISEIFRDTCRLLEEIDVDPEEFVDFFYGTAVLPVERYDFFKIKLDRFKRFVEAATRNIDPGKKDQILLRLNAEFGSCWQAYLEFNPVDEA